MSRVGTTRELIKFLSAFGKVIAVLVSMREGWFPKTETLVLLQITLLVSLAKDFGTAALDVTYHRKLGKQPLEPRD